MRLKVVDAVQILMLSDADYQFAIHKFKDQNIFCLLFCMGVKLGR
jgi:hypothetical protein